MSVLAPILLLLAIGLCLLTIRKTSRALGVGVTDALVWLGLADVPAPQTSRRRR